MLLGSGVAAAKTRYVEKWGADIAGACSKTAPCATIGFVIGESSDNDRIIVGPGEYAEQLLLDREGLKLESSTGRNSTFLKANVSTSNIMSITEGKVQVGKVGKGFTLYGTSSSGLGTSNAIRIDTLSQAGRIKIQGNRFGMPRLMDGVGGNDQGYSNGRAINVEVGGYRLQIRDNSFLNTAAQAINCQDCNQALIQGNRIVSTGQEAIFLGNSWQVSLIGNLVSGAYDEGVLANAGSASLKIKDNAALGNGAAAFNIQSVQNSLIQGNVSTQNGKVLSHPTGQGFTLTELTVDKPPQVKHNIAGYNSLDGFLLSNINNVRLSNLLAIGHQGFDGFDLVGVGIAELFKDIGAIDNGCGLEGNSGFTYPVSKLYLSGNSDDKCDANFPETTTRLKKPPKINVRRAAKL